MRAVVCGHLLLSVGTASAFASSTGARVRTTPLRSPKITLKEPFSYDEYLRAKNAGIEMAPDMYAQDGTRDPAMAADLQAQKEQLKAQLLAQNLQMTQQLQQVYGMKTEPTDSDDTYERIPWWQQSKTFSEDQRKDRRTIFMHDDWVRHRSSERFVRNMKTLPSSGINQALFNELAFVTFVAIFVVGFNMLFYNYQDFGGVVHPGPLVGFDTNIKSLSLPALPFSIALPALSLLLVFRTNTAYFRWNEARTLWGGLINNCRNVVRQTNGFFPDDEYHNFLKKRMGAETGAFIKALKNFLRGPSDDDEFRGELNAYVEKGQMSPQQADAVMAASNRPIYCLNAMAMTLRKADIDPMQTSRIDATISTLVDLTGANERIFKSPIPLVYTRLTARFLTIFLIMLPLALWSVLGESWNHWATIPATFMISFFLFGIEEVGIQIEEPFSILPLEAFCNGAISAANEEMLGAVDNKVFEYDITRDSAPAA